MTSDTDFIPSFCRDCSQELSHSLRQTNCHHCGSPRILSHEELHELNIAHIDCDAFYASVEKRDNPKLNSKPLIIGGGKEV